MGRRIATYTLTGSLGLGGFGEVFAAVHDVLRRDVAIKVLHAKWCDDSDAVRRFVAEARAVTAVKHRNIVAVIDFGTLDDGRHYYVMERLEGESLRARLKLRGRLPLDEALPILRGIAAALDAAHDAGIVHRDVKPENVFLHREGDEEIAKLIDFGLAKLVAPTSEALTQSGVIVGTPAYMAPEQCRGAAVDRFTDTYAFGVVMYEMLTGGVPHRGADAVATLLAHVNDPAEPPSRRCDDLPEAIDAVLLPLLAKHATNRPAQLASVVDQLAAIRDRPTRPQSSRRRLAWVAATATCMTAGLVVLGSSWQSTSDHPRVRSAPPALVSVPADATPVIVRSPPPDAAVIAPLPPRPTTAKRPRPNPEEPENPYAP